MVVRVIVRVLIVFAVIVVVYAVIGGHCAADRKLVLHTLKKYVVPFEERMNEQITESGAALRKRVDREYTLTNRDGMTLHGYLIRAKEPSEKYLFCSHSYRSRLAGFEFGQIAPLWLFRGYNVFLVDHRAHGSSGGRFISFGQHEADDCIEWLNFMREEFGTDIKIALTGQSMGAATVLLMSGKENLPDNVRCIISDSGYTDFHTTLWQLIPFPKWLRSVIIGPPAAYLRIFHKVRIKESDALAAVRRAKVPILFLHGAKDTFVPLWMSEQLFDACAGEKERVVFPEATHIKLYCYDPERYTQTVTRFVQRYL